jgi:hypothetical protein
VAIDVKKRLRLICPTYMVSKARDISQGIASSSAHDTKQLRSSRLPFNRARSMVPDVVFSHHARYLAELVKSSIRGCMGMTAICLYMTYCANDSTSRHGV